MFAAPVIPHHFQTIFDAEPSLPMAPSRPTHYAPFGFAGDGWRQMLLPIPADQDPFEFLARLQSDWEDETERIKKERRMGNPRLRDPRDVVSDALMGSCEVFLKLPNEVWSYIASDVVQSGSGAALARTSKAFNHLVTPLLYAHPIIHSPEALLTLTQALASSQRSHDSQSVATLGSAACEPGTYSEDFVDDGSGFSSFYGGSSISTESPPGLSMSRSPSASSSLSSSPSEVYSTSPSAIADPSDVSRIGPSYTHSRPLTSHIHSLTLKTSSVDWSSAESLAQILLSSHISSSSTSSNCTPLTRCPLNKLHIEFAGSELERALPFLRLLSPKDFRWNTAPCWLIRPADVFEDLLSSWTDLHTLGLSGFFWDATFTQSLLRLGSLRSLHLSGRTMSSLSKDTLSEILRPQSHSHSSRRRGRGLGDQKPKLALQRVDLYDLPPGKATLFTQLAVSEGYIDDFGEGGENESAASTSTSNTSATVSGYATPTRPSLHSSLSYPVHSAAAAAATAASGTGFDLHRPQLMHLSTALGDAAMAHRRTQREWEFDNHDWDDAEGKGWMVWTR